MTDPSLVQFHEAIAKRRAAALAREALATAREHSADDDLIPEVQWEKSEQDSEVDRIVEGIGIVDAYNRWCGKMRAIPRPGQTEGVKASCPIPGHRDSNPSAWLNTDKNTWFCGTCQQGGDVKDIAAYRFGFSVPSYKSDGKYPDLLRRMVKDLGYQIERSSAPNIPDRVYKPEPVELSTTEVDKPSVSEKSIPLATVHTIIPPEDDIEQEIVFPTLNWQEIVTPDTFLAAYMDAAKIDDAAEEFHFWNAIVAVGLAVGRDIVLWDSIPVYANVMLCILGQSGDRKSRSLTVLKDLLQAALPFDNSSDFPLGAKVVSGAASGEAMIAAFCKELMDTTKGKPVPTGVKAPIRGLFTYSELSGLIGRAGRSGSVIKDTLMQFADTDSNVSTTSITRGTSSAEHAFASAWTSTQPESLRDLISEGDTTSGFLNRWFFASGKAKKKISVGGQQIDISKAVRPLQDLHGLPKRVITWSEPALKLFDEHFHTVLEPAQRNNPVMARLDLLEKKLVLILSINEKLTEVSEDVVRKVIKMHPYLISAYGLTSDAVNRKSLNNEIHSELIRHIVRLNQKNPTKPPTRKNVRDCIARKGWDPILVDRIFDLIDKDERVEKVPSQGQKGRPTEYYRWVG